jgi:hypothetical protein
MKIAILIIIEGVPIRYAEEIIIFRCVNREKDGQFMDKEAKLIGAKKTKWESEDQFPAFPVLPPRF